MTYTKKKSSYIERIKGPEDARYRNAGIIDLIAAACAEGTMPCQKLSCPSAVQPGHFEMIYMNWLGKY